MKMFAKLGLLFSIIALPLAALGQGPNPWTGEQFPQWFSSQPVQQVASSNASEVVLYQVALPRYAIGNNGCLTITLGMGSPDAAAATVTHAIKGYLGGTNAAIGAVWASGSAIATPVFTNTFTTTAGQVIVQYLCANNSSTANLFYGTTTTNSFSAGDYRRSVTYGTQTNGIFFTITGSAGGTGGSTNVVNLDFAELQALTIP